MLRFTDSVREKLAGDEPGSFSEAILAGLSRKPKSDIYQGTVPAAVKARNRAANKVARRSRRINRKANR